MYQALYRKWRPKTFDDVVGQQHVTETLKNEILTGKIGHAYLFTGSRGTGKTTCAKILAKTVNCRNPQNGNPCLECDLCRGIEEGRILDVVEQDAASNNRVDDVRALREETSFTPVEAKYRVYILDEAHMLTTGAVNALLKIMEEPPEHVIFILATTEVHKIPETLLSRCQRFDFKRVPVELIAQRLGEIARQENASITPEAARRIGELADGGMRDAISLLDQSMSVSRQVELGQVNRVAGVVDKEHLFSLAEAVQKQDCAGVMECIDQLYQGSFDLDKLCGDLHSHFRDLMLAKTIRPDQLERYVAGTPETRERLSDQAAGFSLSAILHSMTALQQAQSRLTKTSGARMELELCLLSLANPKLDYSLEALLRRVEALEQAVRGMGAAALPSPQPETAQEKSKPIVPIPEKEIPEASSQERLPAADPVWQPLSEPPEEPAPWEEPPLSEPPPGEPSAPPFSQKRHPPSQPIQKNPANSRPGLQEVPLPAAKELEKGLAEFSQWEDVLESLSVSNPALRGALNGSKAYRKGTDLMLIDGSNAFILLIKNSETAKESLREALRAVTGKKFRLGPYKRQKESESTSPDRFAALQQRAQELGIQFDTL